MEYNIAVIPGDGIGPEIVRSSIRVLNEISRKFSHKFNYEYLYAGGAAIDRFDTPLPIDTLESCKNSDAILLGTIGGEKWNNLNSKVRPEQALLGLRKGLKLYCNLRPVKVYKELMDVSPIKEKVNINSKDILFVREFNSGIYFGKRGIKYSKGERIAYDILNYEESEIKRIAKIAFEVARKRNKKVTSVDKANLLETSRLWRSIVIDMAKDYPDVKLNNMYINGATVEIIKNSSDFDVILVENMFGDILSNEASLLTASTGIIPSGAIGDGKLGMYEPVYGSYCDIEEINLVNPIGAILSVALMLKYSLNLEKESEIIEEAVESIIKKGYRTKDLKGDKDEFIGTSEITELIIKEIKNISI